MSKRIWSYSALTQYLRCPLQFYFQRILDIPPAFTPATLAFGSSVHEALAVYHSALQRDIAIDDGEIRAAFLESWDRRKQREKITFTEATTEKSLLAKGIALLDAYLKEPPPQDIVGVEMTLMTPVHNSNGEALPAPMKTVIDLLTRDPGQLLVWDFKTSSRAYSEMETELSLQATIYSNSVWQIYKELPAFEFVVLLKTKSPKIQRVPTTRAPDDFGRLGDLIQVVDRAVKADMYYPIESCLNCSTCAYRKPCRSWISDPCVPKQETSRRISSTDIPFEEDQACNDTA